MLFLCLFVTFFRTAIKQNKKEEKKIDYSDVFHYLIARKNGRAYILWTGNDERTSHVVHGLTVRDLKDTCIIESDVLNSKKSHQDEHLVIILQKDITGKKVKCPFGVDLNGHKCKALPRHSMKAHIWGELHYKGIDNPGYIECPYCDGITIINPSSLKRHCKLANHKKAVAEKQDIIAAQFAELLKQR